MKIIPVEIYKKEKHKICSNRTKSLLIANQSNIISKKNEDFAMERPFVI